MFRFRKEKKIVTFMGCCHTNLTRRLLFGDNSFRFRKEKKIVIFVACCHQNLTRRLLFRDNRGIDSHMLYYSCHTVVIKMLTRRLLVIVMEQIVIKDRSESES
jgi:hypothetical protein